jgi:selenide,water dikinase
VLERVLKRLPQSHDPNLLVGFNTADDAAVYRLTDQLAIVQTVDFFTPIVDDPVLYGQIAASNSLSDVYAMGGRPISALTIVAFPASQSAELLEQILRGGLEKMTEANCSVVGGHSIRDDDLKFGYAVTGLIDPEKIWRNVGARPGDKLVLTKPIGTGVISTALKQGKADSAWVAAATDCMAQLNRAAAEALHELDDASHAAKPVHAVTDVTGFGVLGHAREMAVGSDVSLRIDHSRIAYIQGAVEAARGKFFSGGMANNREFLEGCVEVAPGIPAEYEALLYDPQTSGGLLAAVDADAIDAAIASLERHKVPARVIGEVIPKHAPLIEVK